MRADIGGVKYVIPSLLAVESDRLYSTCSPSGSRNEISASISVKSISYNGLRKQICYYRAAQQAVPLEGTEKRGKLIPCAPFR